jgi:DNA-binding winged helix-turn-helix (wHTH) protein
MSLKIALINKSLAPLFEARGLTFEVAPEHTNAAAIEWMSSLASSVPLIAVFAANDASERSELLIERCNALRRTSKPISLLGVINAEVFDETNPFASNKLASSNFDDLLIFPSRREEIDLRLSRLARKSVERISRKTELIMCGPLVFDLAAMETKVYGEHIRLTRRETELLLYIARRANTVVTREQIAVDVWHMPYFSDAFDAVLNGHLSRIRDKLGDASCRGILRSVRGQGVMIEPDAVPAQRIFSRAKANAQPLALPVFPFTV